MKRILLAGIAPLALGLAAFGQTTWYVDGVFGNDTNTGASPAQAFATITQGVSFAQTNDVVMVAPGLYTPSKGEVLPIQPSAQGVAIIGAGARVTILDAEWTTGMPCVNHVYLRNDCVLSGFTLRNGPDNSCWWNGAVKVFDRPHIDNVLVENCIIHDVSRGFYVGWGGNAGEGCNNVTIRNNLLFRCRADAIGLWGDNVNGTTSVGNKIINNTVIGDPALVTRSAIFIDHNVTVEIYNNNLYGWDWCGLEAGGNMPSHITTGYNNFYDSIGGRQQYRIDAASTHVMAAPDTTNDPMFVDATTGDGHLLEGSLCIDAGDPTFTSTIDIDGNGLQGTAIDQGCDERMRDYNEAAMYFWRATEGNTTPEMKLLGKAGDGVSVFLSPYQSTIGPINLGAMGTLYLEPLALIPFASAPALGTGGVTVMPAPLPGTPMFLGVEIPMQSVNLDPSNLTLGLSPLEAVYIVL